jgi:hypothetical protein
MLLERISNFIEYGLENVLKVTQFVDIAGFPRASAYGNRGNVPIIVLDTDESVFDEVTNSFKQHSCNIQEAIIHL